MPRCSQASAPRSNHHVSDPQGATPQLWRLPFSPAPVVSIFVGVPHAAENRWGGCQVLMSKPSPSMTTVLARTRSCGTDHRAPSMDHRSPTTDHRPRPSASLKVLDRTPATTGRRLNIIMHTAFSCAQTIAALSRNYWLRWLIVQAIAACLISA